MAAKRKSEFQVPAEESDQLLITPLYVIYSHLFYTILHELC